MWTQDYDRRASACTRRCAAAPVSARSSNACAATSPAPRLPTNGSSVLKRVFDIDIEHCPNCGGELKIIAAIEDPAVIVRILSHLGLPARAPPRAPVRLPELIQAA